MDSATNPEVNATEGETIGQRVKRLRIDKGLTLSALAASAQMSKGYLWNLESGKVRSRPSATTLYGLAQALGVAMSDLFGRPILLETPTDVPPELKAFAKEDHLPAADVRMLAGIQFRGEHPRTTERWRFIYNSIRHSVGMDPPLLADPNSREPDS